jgi:N-acetylmuramoyl-L-alanine amidase
MNHFRVRIFSAALVLALMASELAFAPARAQSPPATTFWFAGTRLIFDSPVALDGDVAVAVRDSGLQRLLARVGASISYEPQQRYIVITSADRRIISFTVGDARYAVAGVVASASFAPFFDGNDVIVPLYAIARALYVQPIAAGGDTVFEPQIGALDVRPDGRRTIVTLHAATALKYVKTSETPERLSVTFSGVGSALSPNRHIGGGIDDVDVAVSGPVKNPASTVTITAPKGAQHLIAVTASPYDFTAVFGPPGVALDLDAPSPNAASGVSGTSGGMAAGGPAAAGAPVAAAPPSATPPLVASPLPAAPGGQPPPAVATVPQTEATPQSGAASVTGVAVDVRSDGGLDVRLSIDGTATYDWHRLRDGRWYLDVADSKLRGPARDERPISPAVESVRVRQIGSPDAPVVRVAFTLHGDRRVDVTPADGSLTLSVANADDNDLARTGNGQIGGATVASSSAQSPAGPPLAPIAPQPETTPWKFGPPAADGNRTIVIDPGHGGDDAGTAHNGLVEKELTLAISLRLRTLLTQAGWNVRLTRETDIDPVSPELLSAFAGDGRPNSSDRAYLQTRCDVANASNARLFISIHVNYADATSVRGTTFYYTKPQDVPLAQALERSVIPVAGTQDDGVVKSNLYVTKHTNMPAVLIETGFISNPGDVRLLADRNFLQTFAAGIAAGVKAYAGALPAMSSKTDQ